MNPGTELILNLLGGVALLLWGVRMVRTGIMRAYGDRLKRFIEQNLGNSLAAYVTGGAATLFLQSSTATALLVAGLTAGGMVGAATGLAANRSYPLRINPQMPSRKNRANTITKSANTIS